MRSFALINVGFSSTDIDEAYIDPSTAIGAHGKYLGLPSPNSVAYGTVLLLESGHTIVWAREWATDWYMALWLLSIKVEL